MNATATLKIEDFGVGTDIKRACQEAKRLADLLQVRIYFVFNGVHCYMNPGQEYETLIQDYSRSWESESDHRSAYSS